MSKFRYGTKRYLIEEIAIAGKSRQEAYTSLRPMVEQGLKPMVFKRNVKGSGRVPKPLGEQLIELKNEINRVYAILDLQGEALNTSHAEEESTPEETPQSEIQEEEETQEEEESSDTEEEEKPILASGKVRIESELQKFLRRVREIRTFCEDRAKVSETIDTISMRPVQAASKLIPAGIPCDALLDSMSMHWPKDVRRDASISDFDFESLALSIKSDRGLPDTIEIAGEEEELHKLFPYALTLAEQGQPIMLIGPAGTGKSHLAFQLSRFLNLDYGETPMSPGASRGDLLGRHTIGGFIAAKFVEMYSGGGVFNFEEIDSADPSMLIVLNNALASKQLFNSMSGERHDRHEDFIPVSTANTFGLGSNRDYTARERLDAATIDRWRMGRIWLALDESVEESMLHS